MDYKQTRDRYIIDDGAFFTYSQVIGASSVKYFGSPDSDDFRVVRNAPVIMRVALYTCLTDLLMRPDLTRQTY